MIRKVDGLYRIPICECDRMFNKLFDYVMADFQHSIMKLADAREQCLEDDDIVDMADYTMANFLEIDSDVLDGILHGEYIIGEM